MKNLKIAPIITALLFFGCCPKLTNENVLEIIPAPSPHLVRDSDRRVYSKSVFIKDEITRSEKSDSFLIVDLEPRDTGSPPMPRRRLNQKKYVSVRTKGGEAQ